MRGTFAVVTSMPARDPAYRPIRPAVHVLMTTKVCLTWLSTFR